MAFDKITWCAFMRFSLCFVTHEGLIMPQLEATLRRFEEAGLGKYVLPDVQKKYMLRCSVNPKAFVRFSNLWKVVASYIATTHAMKIWEISDDFACSLRFGQIDNEDQSGEGLGIGGPVIQRDSWNIIGNEFYVFGNSVKDSRFTRQGGWQKHLLGRAQPRGCRASSGEIGRHLVSKSIRLCDTFRRNSNSVWARHPLQNAKKKMKSKVLQQQSASAEELEIARMQAEAAEVSAVKARIDRWSRNCGALEMIRRCQMKQLFHLVWASTDWISNLERLGKIQRFEGRNHSIFFSECSNLWLCQLHRRNQSLNRT